MLLLLFLTFFVVVIRVPVAGSTGVRVVVATAVVITIMVVVISVFLFVVVVCIFVVVFNCYVVVINMYAIRVMIGDVVGCFCYSYY